MTDQWPPPVTTATPWRTVPVRVPGQSVLDRARVRPVRLWGQEVWIDDEQRVHCPHCLGLHTTDELARPDNAHPVGLPARIGGLLPTSSEDQTERGGDPRPGGF